MLPAIKLTEFAIFLQKHAPTYLTNAMTINPQKDQVIEIFDQVTELKYDINKNRFVLLRLKKDVGSILSKKLSDPTVCYMTLALISFNLGSTDDAMHFFNNAILLRPNDQILLQNYVNIAFSSGRIKDANKVTVELVNKFPGSKTCLKCATLQSVCTLQVSDYFKYVEQYLKLMVNEETNISSALNASMLLLKRTMEDRSIPQQHLIELLETAAKAVLDKGVEILNSTGLILTDGTGIHYFYLNKTMEECSKLDWVIADALVENFDDSGMDYLSIACRPIDHFDPSIAMQVV